MKMKAKALWLAPALILASGLTQAGGVRMYGEGEIPQASEVAQILSGGAALAPRPKFRGISLDPQPTVATASIDTGIAKVAKPEQDAIGVPVEFAFNSADIASGYRAQLDAIAEGIKMTGGVAVVVEGHTDAYGAEGYNQQLSVRRANAVKTYLVSKHGIADKQLIVKGYGESAPLDSSHPFASNNRRVQFRAAN